MDSVPYYTYLTHLSQLKMLHDVEWQNDGRKGKNVARFGSE